MSDIPEDVQALAQNYALRWGPVDVRNLADLFEQAIMADRRSRDTAAEGMALALDDEWLRQAARQLAVSSVDSVHGYTVEFSHSPANHRDEYDKAESSILFELRRALAAYTGKDGKE